MPPPRAAYGAAAKARRVDRALAEGDEVAGFRVLDTPGHAPGHVAY